MSKPWTKYGSSFIQRIYDRYRKEAPYHRDSGLGEAYWLGRDNPESSPPYLPNTQSAAAWRAGADTAIELKRAEERKKED